jgi:hypothetical protein
VQVATRRHLRRHLRREHPETHARIRRHVLGPDLMFGKKLIIVARKEG